MDTKLKAVSDVAIILGCAESTIYKYVRAGKIPHKRAGEKMIRFSDSDIQAYLESIKVGITEDRNGK